MRAIPVYQSLEQEYLEYVSTFFQVQDTFSQKKKNPFLGASHDWSRLSTSDLVAAIGSR